jgi:hypothetical protein
MKYRLVSLDLIYNPSSFICYDIILNTLNIISRYSMSNSVYQAFFGNISIYQIDCKN